MSVICHCSNHKWHWMSGPMNQMAVSLASHATPDSRWPMASIEKGNHFLTFAGNFLTACASFVILKGSYWSSWSHWADRSNPKSLCSRQILWNSLLLPKATSSGEWIVGRTELSKTLSDAFLLKDVSFHLHLCRWFTVWQLLSLFASYCSSRLPLALAFLFAWSSLRFCSAVGDDFIVNMCKHSFTESRVSRRNGLVQIVFLSVCLWDSTFHPCKIPTNLFGMEKTSCSWWALFLEGPWHGKETVEPDKHTNVSNVAMCKSITWKQERQGLHHQFGTLVSQIDDLRRQQNTVRCHTAMLPWIGRVLSYQ